MVRRRDKLTNRCFPVRDAGLYRVAAGKERDSDSGLRDEAALGWTDCLMLHFANALADYYRRPPITVHAPAPLLI